MTGMNLPELFIVGAAKSGTTSLFYYLTQHPMVVGPSIKEPNFFCHDQAKRILGPGKGPGDAVATHWTHTLDEYADLFANLKSGQIGCDASVANLYSPIAAGRIKGLVPDAKIVAILRNPIERAWSSYMHMKRDSRETLGFMAALREEDRRIEKGWEFSWHYKRLGLYAAQIERFLDHFGADSVRVYLFDDLRTRARDLVAETLHLVDLEDAPTISTAMRHNRSGEVRSKWVADLLSRPSRTKSFVRRLLPLRVAHYSSELLIRLNVRDTKVGPDPNAREWLTDFYRDDVARLGSLLGRDLSHWLT